MIRRLRFLRPTYRMRRRGPRAAPRRKRLAGASLVELLVAVLVVGVGVLGVTGLQMLSMQSNRAALLRTEAAQLAQDMMGRIRAGAAGRHAAPAYGGLAIGDLPPAPPGCGSHECSLAQMALFDQAVWKCSLGRFAHEPLCRALAGTEVEARAGQGIGLPDGDGSVDVDVTTGLVRVTVTWRENSRQQSISIESRV